MRLFATIFLLPLAFAASASIFPFSLFDGDTAAAEAEESVRALPDDLRVAPPKGIFACFEDAVFPAGDAEGFSVSVRPVLTNRLDGAWEVTVRAPGLVSSTFFPSDGSDPVGPFSLDRFTVVAPALWSDEHPVCHRLAIETESGGVEALVRFCTHETSGGIFVLNGRPVTLRAGGLASAKLSPVSSEDARDAAFAALRAARCNAVFADTLPGSASFRARCFAAGVFPVARGDAVATDFGDVLDTADPLRAEKLHRNRLWRAVASAASGRVTVSNLCHSTDASAVTLEWTLLEDGVASDSGTMPLYGLKPGASAKFDLPASVTESMLKAVSSSVRFAFVADGVTVAEDQTDFSFGRDLTPYADAGEEIGFSENDGTRAFSVGAIRLAFDLETGLLREVSHPFLRWWKGPSLGVTPIILRETAEGVRTYIPRATRLSPVGRRFGALVFDSESDLFGLDGTGRHGCVRVRWSVFPDGTLAVDAHAAFTGSDATRGVGFAFVPSDPSSETVWFGRGPWAHDSAACASAFVGRWSARDFSGRRTEVRAASVGPFILRTVGSPASLEAELVGETREFRVFFPGDRFAFVLSADGEPLTARVSPGAFARLGGEAEEGGLNFEFEKTEDNK